MAVKDWVERDLAVLWHPCTQMKDHPEVPLLPIRRAKGVWLEDYAGKRYLDAISSWWVNLFGHGNTQIAFAIRRQLDRLEHVLLAGCTHEPAVALAERLTGLAPAGLSRCFFADNGSAAVEVAMKMSFHYWQNRGQPRKRRFVCLQNGYHGETLGALSVGGVPLYRDAYGPLLLDTIAAPSPDCYSLDGRDAWERHCRRKCEEMEALLAQHKQEVCAVIVEPLVQCAGGMRMYHPVYLSLLREACDRHEVHLIADEIAVGFGRTGTLFACEQAAISPDFLCLSKGLTGGFLPLSAVLVPEGIYQAFYGDYAERKAFLHSHSYTGNPLACSAALATLDIFNATPVLRDNRRLARCMAEAVEDLRQHPNVAEIRQQGMILALELVRDRRGNRPFPWQERRGMRVYRHGLQRGVLLRPLGDVIYFMPPYVITPLQIEEMAQAAREGIEIAVRN